MIKFYEIDDSYMQRLHDNVDPKVLMHNTGTQKRKFIAVKIQFDGCDYYVPMSSPDSADFIVDRNGKRKVRRTTAPTIMRFFKGSAVPRNYLGKLLFSNMIPVPPKYATLVDITAITDIHYRTLLQDQYRVLRTSENWEEIQKRAILVHSMKLKNEDYGYVRATVDFIRLEKAYKEECVTE